MLFISYVLITRNLANYIKSYLRDVVDRGLQITKNYLKFYNLILEYLCISISVQIRNWTSKSMSILNVNLS